MEREEFTGRLRSVLFGALTGRGGDVSGSARADLRSMLTAAYGPGRRGGVNTRAAAADLGVSQRTVQRWLTQTGTQRQAPRPQSLTAIRAAARRAATTKAGRRAALAAARRGPAARYGARLSVRGVQGPGPADYARLRRVERDLDPDQVQALYDAYEQRGDKGAIGWLENHLDQEYVPGWTIRSVDDIDLHE